jgi:hypothetical protein
MLMLDVVNIVENNILLNWVEFGLCLKYRNQQQWQQQLQGNP